MLLCILSICKAHLWEVGWKEEESEERGAGGGLAFFCTLSSA